MYDGGRDRSRAPNIAIPTKRPSARRLPPERKNDERGITATGRKKGAPNNYFDSLCRHKVDYLPLLFWVAMVKGRIEIDSERCKACLLCIEFCPKKAISLSNKLNSKGYFAAVFNEESECTGCASCSLICPDVAIEVYRA